MPQDQNTRIVARDGFARANLLRQQADKLPRWRWWRRRRLLARAEILERATSLFWRDHANDLP